MNEQEFFDYCSKELTRYEARRYSSICGRRLYS